MANPTNRIEASELLDAIDYGKPVILHYYPQSEVGFSGNKNFSIRPDDKHPSAAIFKHKDGGWMIQDKGGADTAAKGAFTLVMENEGLSYGQAINWVAERFAPSLLGNIQAASTQIKPDIKPAPVPVDDITVGKRSDGKFTPNELKQLGHEINELDCKELNLIPLDYYVTKKNAEGKSWMICANDSYPIYYYDYGSWGKIYQPLGDVRFLYVGKKPEKFIFGDRRIMALYENGTNGKFPEVDPDTNTDERVEEIVICSGPSDALNIRSNGYHVCWLNSETEDIEPKTWSILSRIAKQVYICYDLDDTGIRNAYRLALHYLDLNIINLPEDLPRFKTRKGKPSKDAKDFFMHYRTPKHRNPKKHFEMLVKTAISLKFWVIKTNPKGEFSGYDISNEQLYAFLHANGLFRIETNVNKKGYTFCHIKDNIVKRIDEEAVQSYVNGHLVQFIKENPEHYSVMLLNAVHRSNQIKLGSLEKLKIAAPDFKSFDRDYDHFFFKNVAVKITRDAITPYKLADCGKFVYDFKIIDHDYKPIKPLFAVSYTPEFAALKAKLQSGNFPPLSPELKKLKEQIDGVKEHRRYSIQVNDWDFTFLKYVYNTGRIYWQKEEAGIPLTEEEQQEVNLHFISKICAIGYQIFRFKEKGMAYNVYAMETETSDVGTHLGGTGKSILMSSIEYVRNQIFVDGQKPGMQDSEHLFSGVERGVTEHLFFDDLSDQVDLHRFMPLTTGKMEVRALYRNTEVIPYEESPKCGFTSNHGIRNFDSSLRRRTWFIAFSSYYHPEDKMKGMSERSPLTEFGKNLLSDYTPEEMNKFYNFMAQCLQTYLQFRERVQPPMDAIERRNIQRSIGDDFIWWADDYFSADKLNCNIDRNQVFEDYKATLPEKIAKVIKTRTFKSRLLQYCQFKGYIFNPEELLKSPTEKERNEIREYREGSDIYCFHIRTDNENLRGDDPNMDPDANTPPF